MKFVRCADLVVGERAKKNHQVTEDEDGSGVVLLLLLGSLFFQI